MQPLVSRLGVGPILPIIDSNWHLVGKNPVIRACSGVWMYFSWGNPGPGHFRSGGIHLQGRRMAIPRISPVLSAELVAVSTVRTWDI